MSRIAFFTIHSTTRWWTYLGSKLDCADATVVSDLRGDGDRSLVDDFYGFLRQGDVAQAAIMQFGEDGCADIIRRCRVLRSLDRTLAMRMIGAMARTIERAFDAVKPDLVITFTIDRYVMDVMDRVGRNRGIDFLEMTTSIFPEEVLFMRRGRLVPLWEPDEGHVQKLTDVLCAGNFAPSYVRDAKRFTPAQFWRVYGYFALRGAYFNLLRYIKRDPQNLHYVDALKRLKHKVGMGDIAVLGLLDEGWAEKIASVPREKRVFFGLQLFPEASLDYWLRDPAMVDHDEAVLRYCEVLGAAGYRILIKDHPLQFGFRQRGLIERLVKMPEAILVPYDVPANVLIAECGVSVTFTGTIGFQAALAGLCSVVTEPYYADEPHYLHVRRFSDIDGVAQRIATWRPPADMAAARLAMVRHLARGSVPGDYFTWRNFDPDDSEARRSVQTLVDSLNTYLPRLLGSNFDRPGGKDRSLPAGL
jgi:hypothetical protein